MCLLTLSFIYCSNNDDDANGQDPKIGTWLSSQELLEFPDGSEMDVSPVATGIFINFTLRLVQMEHFLEK